MDFDGPDSDLLLERGGRIAEGARIYRGALAAPGSAVSRPGALRLRQLSRDSRLAELRLSAEVAAQRVRETRVPFRFNPMAPRERRIIHLVLKDQPGVRTSSEGVGDERHVVILPAESNAPGKFRRELFPTRRAAAILLYNCLKSLFAQEAVREKRPSGAKTTSNVNSWGGRYLPARTSVGGLP